MMRVLVLSAVVLGAPASLARQIVLVETGESNALHVIAMQCVRLASASVVANRANRAAPDRIAPRSGSRGPRAHV